MTTRTTAPRITSSAAACPDCDDGLGSPKPVVAGGWRDRIRRQPGLRQCWRLGVFIAGLLCVCLGLALAVLPGPLTIPPVLLGLWVWSTEFHWAQRFFDTFQEKGKDAWQHARRHPVGSTAITVGGLGAAAAMVWLVGRFELTDRILELVGR